MLWQQLLQFEIVATVDRILPFFFLPSPSKRLYVLEEQRLRIDERRELRSDGCCEEGEIRPFDPAVLRLALLPLLLLSALTTNRRRDEQSSVLQARLPISRVHSRLRHLLLGALVETKV